jgi:ankyrin repeat protein
VEIVKQLLHAQTKVNHQDRRLRTALHCACARGQLGVIRVLIENGGQKTFSLWIYFGQYLCAGGASGSLENTRGDVPLHEAVHMGCTGRIIVENRSEIKLTIKL